MGARGGEWEQRGEEGQEESMSDRSGTDLKGARKKKRKKEI